MPEAMLQLMSDATALFMLWLFGQAGVHKLHPANQLYFSSLIAEYGVAHQTAAAALAKMIGVLELAIAIAIVYPPTRQLAAIAAALLLLGYMAMMGYQLYRGRRELDCGCSGPASQLKMSGHLLVRNAVLGTIALLCLFPGQSYGAGASFWLLALALALTGILLNLCCELLIGNAQKLKALRS